MFTKKQSERILAISLFVAAFSMLTVFVTVCIRRKSLAKALLAVAAMEGADTLEHELHELEHEHHHHHHEHDEHCTCGCHDHDHHHHHADEVFTSWGVETHKKFDKAAVEHALHHLDSGEYGMVLRAKGIIEGNDGSWIHFDYVPGECNVRKGSPAVTGKLCVIGAELKEEKIAELFGV